MKWPDFPLDNRKRRRRVDDQDLATDVFWMQCAVLIVGFCLGLIVGIAL